MDERLDQNTRSADELAILQAFEAMDLGDMDRGSLSPPVSKKTDVPLDIVQPPLIPLPPIVPISPATAPPAHQETSTSMLSENEMLALFVGEVDEDIRAIRHILRHIEPEEHLDTGSLQRMQRLAHKIKGTSGSIGCTAMSTIASYIEELTKWVAQGALVPFMGLHVLGQSLYALEMTLKSMVTYGTESKQSLADLEAEYLALNIDIQEKSTLKPLLLTSKEEDKRPSEHAIAPASMRIDVRRFEQLVLHTEELAELQASIQDVQAEVEHSLQELHAAQTRLRHIEALVATKFFVRSSDAARQLANDERPTSSLVARILDEATQRTGHAYQRKSKYIPPSLKSGSLAGWDAFEMDHFTENDVLIRSLDEAVADVATATARLRLALTHLNHVTQEHIAQASQVRNDTLLLRLTPLSSLVGRIERAVTMSTMAQGRQVRFEAEGSATEIDQDILEELKQPFLQLVRACLAQSYREPIQQTDQTFANTAREQNERIWLHVRAFGNEVVLELGFSMAVGGGALDGIQETLHRLNGSASVRQNTSGGITFVLRLPRTQGAVRCLLVRVGSHRVVVPFTQVQRIYDGKHHNEAWSGQDDELAGRPQEAALHTGQRAEEHYNLHTLLGFPVERNPPRTEQPVLLVSSNSTPFVVQVDEILGDVELVVKPLTSHLQRPGIMGTVIDGMRNVLLVVDIPELVRHAGSSTHERYTQPRLESRTGAAASKQKMYQEQVPLTVMVADDSVYIRQSVRYTLSRAGYRVIEAEDGMKALELLVDQPPDALILDMEMPNLNGYDVLSMMRVHPELAEVKVVMLTSRLSEKHQARARELGAHSYLTKPCPEDTLLSTLHKLLTS